MTLQSNNQADITRNDSIYIGRQVWVRGFATGWTLTGEKIVLAAVVICGGLATDTKESAYLDLSVWRLVYSDSQIHDKGE